MSRYPMIQRMQDYWDDAWYAPHEVHELEAEIRAVRPTLPELLELAALCAEARQLGLGLCAVAD